MESVGHVVVPLRVGGKKMKKRRELDALVAHSLAKRACSSAKRQAGNGITSQDQLLSQSTDDQEDSNWSKVPVSTRCKTKRYSFIRTCGPLVFLMSIFILFGFMYWLYFDLRQQIYEHRMKIEEVSASSQFLPDALQKWHEATKLLEHNQTIVNNKLVDIQYRIDNFEKELADVKEGLIKKEADSEKEKLAVLQNSVGTFGAKIQDISIDVESLKENIKKFQNVVYENKNNLTKLLTKLDFVMVNYSTPMTNLNNEKLEQLVNNVTQTISNEMHNLTAQVATVNDTLSQRIKGLEDDIRVQKPKFDALIENFANMSSHVTSIEDDWTKYKHKTVNLEEATIKFNAELNFLKNNSDRLAISVNEIQNEQRRRQSMALEARKGTESSIFQIRKNLTIPLAIFVNNTSPKKITPSNFNATSTLLEPDLSTITANNTKAQIEESHVKGDIKSNLLKVQNK